MGVNRESRDRLATALAAYMRGEITNLDLDKVVHELGSDDEAVNRIILLLWFLYDDFKAHPLHVTREGWEGLQKALVFLKTDLEPRSTTGSRRWLHRDQIEAVVLLGACGVAAWWFWDEFSLVLACWTLIGGFWWHIVGGWRRRRCRRQQPADNDLFFPFASEDEWQSHRHLLDQVQLPPYDRAEHGSCKPIRHPVVGWIMGLPAALVMAMLVPLWSVLMLLPRRESRPAGRGGATRQ